MTQSVAYRVSRFLPSVLDSQFTILFGKGVRGQAQRCRKRRDIRDVRNLAFMRRSYVRSGPIADIVQVGHNRADSAKI